MHERSYNIIMYLLTFHMFDVSLKNTALFVLNLPSPIPHLHRKCNPCNYTNQMLNCAVGYFSGFLLYAR